MAVTVPSKQRFSGGSLIGPVAPLPDDDTESQVAAPTPESEPVPGGTVESARGRQGPPSTLRVNERAGEALWDAYLKAKTADPFLSFRQFASTVILDGLDREARRAKRRS